MTDLTQADQYVLEVYRREHPWALDGDEIMGIVEFSDSDLIDAFNAGRLAGERDMRERSAVIAARHASARRKAMDHAKARHAKAEARDYESMAIEGVQIECAIRAIPLAGEPLP